MGDPDRGEPIFERMHGIFKVGYGLFVGEAGGDALSGIWIYTAEGAEAAIRWWRDRGEDPRQKLIIFSDGLDVDRIVALHRQFHGRVKVSFGWGTLLTNDFRGFVPGDGLAPFSLVCKAVAADGRPTVKLSDNPAKAMGPAAEIERYKRVFDVGHQALLDVVV